MLSVPLGKRPLFDKLWKFLRHPKGTIERGILTQKGRRVAERGRGHCFPGWLACDSQLSVRKYLRSNLQGVKVCSAHGFRGLSPWSGDLQEAHGRGGWSHQGSRWSKRVRRHPGSQHPLENTPHNCLSSCTIPHFSRFYLLPILPLREANLQHIGLVGVHTVYHNFFPHQGMRS